MADVKRNRNYPQLGNILIGILSFYKAQVTRFKATCYDLLGVIVTDRNKLSSLVSVSQDSG